jgi:hypothetical protein
MGKTRTDQLMTFLNRVAAEIHKTNPDKCVGTFAYIDSRTPPTTVKPLDNVIVEYVTGIFWKYTLDDPKCKYHATMAREMEGWLKMIKPDHFIWSTFGVPKNDDMLPVAGIWARDLKWFHELGIAGFENCVTPGSWDELKLNNYVTAKVGWDASLKYEDILDDFCKNLYGPAAEPMKKYYLALDRAAQESPGWEDPTPQRVLTPRVQKELNGYLMEALRMAAAPGDAAFDRWRYGATAEEAQRMAATSSDAILRIGAAMAGYARWTLLLK